VPWPVQSEPDHLARTDRTSNPGRTRPRDSVQGNSRIRALRALPNTRQQTCGRPLRLGRKSGPTSFWGMALAMGVSRACTQGRNKLTGPLVCSRSRLLGIVGETPAPQQPKRSRYSHTAPKRRLEIEPISPRIALIACPSQPTSFTRFPASDSKEPMPGAEKGGAGGFCPRGQARGGLSRAGPGEVRRTLVSLTSQRDKAPTRQDGWRIRPTIMCAPRAHHRAQRL